MKNTKFICMMAALTCLGLGVSGCGKYDYDNDQIYTKHKNACEASIDRANAVVDNNYSGQFRYNEGICECSGLMCKMGQVCNDFINNTAPKCVEYVCANDTTRCAGDDVVSFLYRCINNSWQVMGMCNPGSCDGNMCTLYTNTGEEDPMQQEKQCLKADYCKKIDIDGEGEGRSAFSYLSCLNGEWSSEVCPAKCDDGKGCIKECENGKTECLSNRSVRSCINGMWSEAFDCEDGQFCNDKTGRCDVIEEVVCENEEEECLNEQVQPNVIWGKVRKCSNGKFSQFEWCNSTEDVHPSCHIDDNRGECGRCVDGTVECRNEGEKYVICSNGIWGIEENCSDGKICLDGNCVEQTVCSKLGSYRCKEESGKVTLEKCVGDNGNTFAIGGGGNNSGGGISWSNNVSVRLNGTWKPIDMRVEDCNRCLENGKIGNKKEEVCVGCKDYQMKCENGKLYSCNHGRWYERGSDGFNDYTGAKDVCVCKSDEDLKGDNVVDDFNQDDNVKKLCRPCYNDTNKVGHMLNGVSKNDNPACEGNVSCKADFSGCGVCVNDSKMCDMDDAGASVLKTCENGKWGKTKSCSGFGCFDNNDGKAYCGVCETDNNCGIGKKCQEGQCMAVGDNHFNCRSDDGKQYNKGEGYCKDEYYIQCSETGWNENKCENGCDEESGCIQGAMINPGFECLNGGKVRCSNAKDTMIGTLSCTSSGDTFTCDNVSCARTISGNTSSLDHCGECLNGETQCSNDGKLQTCVEGKWDEGTPCSSFSICEDNGDGNAVCKGDADEPCNGDEEKCYYTTNKDDGSIRVVHKKCKDNNWSDLGDPANKLCDNGNVYVDQPRCGNEISLDGQTVSGVFTYDEKLKFENCSKGGGCVYEGNNQDAHCVAKEEEFKCVYRLFSNNQVKTVIQQRKSNDQWSDYKVFEDCSVCRKSVGKNSEYLVSVLLENDGRCASLESTGENDNNVNGVLVCDSKILNFKQCGVGKVCCDGAKMCTAFPCPVRD